MRRGCLKRDSREREPDIGQRRASESVSDAERLYHKKNIGTLVWEGMAGTTGLEPAATAVTERK
jgi:hypothetical protein